MMKYKVITIRTSIMEVEATLNEWAEKGYRLVAVTDVGPRMQYILEKETAREDPYRRV